MRFFFVISLFLSVFICRANNNLDPVIDSIRISPRNPSVNDSIILNFFLSNASNCNRYKKDIAKDSILLFTDIGCNFPLTGKQVDTISLGRLAAKQYKIHYRVADLGKICGDADTIFILSISGSMKVREANEVRTIQIIHNSINNDKIVVNIPKTNDVKSIQVIDMRGVILKDLRNVSLVNEVNIATLKAGIYFVKINGQNNILVRKVVKN